MLFRSGTKGPLRRRALLVEVGLWSADQQTAQPLQALVSSELDGSEIKYSLCYSPPGTPALSVLTAWRRQIGAVQAVAADAVRDEQSRVVGRA